MTTNYSKIEEFNDINIKEFSKDDLIHKIGKVIGFIPVIGEEGCSVIVVTSFEIANEIIKMCDKHLLTTPRSETFYKPHSLNCDEKLKVAKQLDYVTIDNFFITVISDNNLKSDKDMVIMYNGI